MNQGTCPTCGRTIVTRLSDGKLRRHGFTLGRYNGQCAGSGQPPLPPQHQPTPHLHDRRTEQ